MTMDPAIKKKWVAALRSGEYEQGQGYLQKDGKFCCLGVLCHVCGAEESLGRLTDWPDANTTDSSRLTWPEVNELAAMNDDDNLSFPEIADWIEEHL